MLASALLPRKYDATRSCASGEKGDLTLPVALTTCEGEAMVVWLRLEGQLADFMLFVSRAVSTVPYLPPLSVNLIAYNDTTYTRELSCVISHDHLGGRSLTGTSSIGNSYHSMRYPSPTSVDPRLSFLPPDLFKGKRVLDIGCNEGWLTVDIGEFVLPIQGPSSDIDISTKIRASEGHRCRS